MSRGSLVSGENLFREGKALSSPNGISLKPDGSPWNQGQCRDLGVGHFPSEVTQEDSECLPAGAFGDGFHLRPTHWMEMSGAMGELCTSACTHAATRQQHRTHFWGQERAATSPVQSRTAFIPYPPQSSRGRAGHFPCTYPVTHQRKGASSVSLS